MSQFACTVGSLVFLELETLLKTKQDFISKISVVEFNQLKSTQTKIKAKPTYLCYFLCGVTQQGQYLIKYI